MKKAMKLVIAGILVLGGIVQTKAATTNLLYNVNVTFTAYLQESLDTNDVGSVETVRGATKDLIALLGAKSANSFPAGARLMLKRTLGSDSAPQFFVRQGGGTNIVDTDVSGLLTLNNITAVKQSLVNGATRFAILEVTLNDTGGHGDFNVQGFAVEGHVKLVENREVLEKESFRGAAAAIAGSGDFSDIAGDIKPAVVKGTIIITFKKVEID